MLFGRKEPSKFAEKRAEAAQGRGKREVERLEKEFEARWHMRPAPLRHKALAARLKELGGKRPEIAAMTLAETRDSERGALRLLLGLKLEAGARGRFAEFKRDLVKLVRSEFPDSPELEVEDLSGGGAVGASEYRVYP